MKRITYLFTVALLLFTAVSCKHNQDVKILKSKKKVFTDGTEIIYQYDKNGKLIYEKDTNEYFPDIYENYYEYDTDNKLSYNKEIWTESSEVYDIYESFYEYDGPVTIKRQHIMSTTDNGGSFTVKDEIHKTIGGKMWEEFYIKYNLPKFVNYIMGMTCKHIISETGYEKDLNNIYIISDARCTNYFSLDGLWLRQDLFDENGEITGISTFEYDSNGKLQKIISDDEPVTILQYNTQGDISYCKFVRITDTIEYNVTYNYDNYGNIIKQVVTYTNGEEEVTTYNKTKHGDIIGEGYTWEYEYY